MPWKIRSNNWENLTHYCAPGRVMWTKCLPRDTVQAMEAALRNSNEIICKHRKLRLQVPGKVSSEPGLTVCACSLTK